MWILEEAFFHIILGLIPNKRFVLCPQVIKRFFQTETTWPSETGPASNLTLRDQRARKVNTAPPQPSIHCVIHLSRTWTLPNPTPT